MAHMFIAMLVICLLATVALADYPAVTGTGLVQKSVLYHTREDPTVEPSNESVDALRTIADRLGGESTHEMILSKHMGKEDDNSLAASTAAREKALAAGEASIAHTKAENNLKEAKELAGEAAQAARRSINATKAAEQSKARFDALQTMENTARVEHSAAKQEYLKAKVAKETIVKRVKDMRDAESLATMKRAETEKKKKAAADNLVLAQRETDAAEEELLKAQTAAQSAKEDVDSATDKFDKVTKMSNEAMADAAALSTALGQEQAKVAKISVDEEEAEKEKKEAMDNYESALQASMDSAAQASEDEARAGAAMEESKRREDEAVNAAAKVGLYPEGSDAASGNAATDLTAPATEVTEEDAAAEATAFAE